MKKILNFGSMNLDYVYQVDHFVLPGETISAVSQAVNPGGKGLNQSIALAKAGACVYHAGCVGSGGERLVDLLQKNRVDTSLICPVEELQGNAMIQVDREGQNCIVLFGGSNQCITEEQVRRTLEAFSAGDWLLLQNETNKLPLMVDLAFERGMRIVLNPSPFNEKLNKVDLHKVAWLLVNEVEAYQLSGSDEPEKVWQTVHEKYPELSLLLTLGSEGSIAFTAHETVRQEAFLFPVTDTTAAGDTYTGYFVQGLMENLPLCDCTRSASMAAGLAVTKPGAAESIPAREEVEEKLKSLP